MKMLPSTRIRFLILALTVSAAAAVCGATNVSCDGCAAGDATSVPAAPREAATSRGTRTLDLIRHGLYDEDDPRDEAAGKGLTEGGRTQAWMTGVRLAAMGIPFDTIWTSPFTRARETAPSSRSRCPV
jgi:hypothetical protein